MLSNVFSDVKQIPEMGASLWGYEAGPTIANDREPDSVLASGLQQEHARERSRHHSVAAHIPTK